MSVVSRTIRQAVRQRAEGRCEYCRKPDILGTYGFHVDHIISQKHFGPTVLNNLAWACYECNICKGTDVASYDPDTKQLAPFYDPRTQLWDGHFQLDGARIVGKTPTGRVTVLILQLNHPDQIKTRQFILAAGLW